MDAYNKEYNDFIQQFEQREVDGQEVGLMIAKFSSWFASYNLEMVEAFKEYANVLRELSFEVDPNGKQISSARAEQLGQATVQYADYQKAKAHVQNIEQHLTSLRALQRGVMAEYTQTAA